MFSTVFFTLICVDKLATPPAPMGNDNSMPPISNEEQALAQQLDSVFNELTKGMSENEKNQFFNELNTAMEEEIDKMSKMSDDELNNYIKEAENELKTLGPWPEENIEKPAVPPVVPQQPVKHEVPIEKEKEVKKPTRDMVPAIDEIAARLDSFIQKANQFVEMSSKFQNWGNSGKLHGWNPTMSWAVFKEKLESLKKTFLAIKSLDPKTQKPKYLVDLAAHEPLCNNINQFKSVLAKHEPNVQVPSFGLKKLSKSSKHAFVAVINDCLEALLALNLQTELEKIIAKYEPTAKKIKEAEEKAQQTALEASKRRTAAPGAMKTTVRRGEQAGYYEFGAPVKSGYPQYGPMPYGPEKKAEPEENGKSGKVKEGEGKGAEQPKKEDKKGPESKKEEVKENETTKKIEQRYDEFVTNANAALDTIADSPNLTHVTAKSQSHNSKELENLASEISAVTVYVKSACKAVRDAAHLIADLDKGQQKDKWIKKFQTGWGQIHGEFMSYRDRLQDIAL